MTRAANDNRSMGGTRYSHDARGRVTANTQSITCKWSGGRVSGIRINGTPLLTAIDYEPFGPVAAWTWGNGEAMSRGYDLAGRPVTYTLGRTRTGAADSRRLSYDGAGRIRSVITATAPGFDQAHDYDGLDRLTATRLGNPVLSSLGFSYDLSGNRTRQTLNDSLTTYTTPTSSNRLQSLSGAQAKSFGYDGAGNQTTSGSLAYGYDNAGRKTSLTVGGQTWTYAYSALGERVKKAGPGLTTHYAYDLQGHLLGEYDGTGNLIQETVWLGDTPVATIRPGGAVYYVHADHLNTPRRITRPSDNQPVWEWESAPFGDTPADENPAGLGAFAYPLRFPGQVYDAESGTNYNYFRDYDPGTGRYAQFDRLGLAGGINGYAYALNNPIRYADPLGLWSTEGHNYFIDSYFGSSLSPEALAAIMAGSAFADSGQFQMSGYEYMHAMRSDADSIAQAKAKACAYWKKSMQAYQLNLDNGRMRDAYFILGMALHAVMDSTSPVHAWGTFHIRRDGLQHGDMSGTKEDLSVAKRPYYEAMTVEAMRQAMQGDPDFCRCSQ